MNGTEFVFNNQTVLILLLLVKTVCGIDLLSFNKILQCMQIPLIVCLPDAKNVLWDGSRTSNRCRVRFYGSCLCFGFMFMIHDTIGCGMMCGDIMTNSFEFSRESRWDVTKSVACIESQMSRQ